ncbi:MAG: cobalt ECF transporter T component CbiQ [Deltaproteobacteria bacterium]|jgi:cobalt/nickel transport system permease protein|nr:cobalt ECF transporter T component CbiQ [Deltaproteobacteria bacterium]
MGHIAREVGSGFLAGVDSRIKLLVMVVWSVLLALVDTYEAAGAGIVGSALLVVLAGPPRPWSFLARVLAVNVFLVFVWLVLPFSFSMPGEPLASLGPLVLTKEGVRLSGLLSLKALGITAGAMAVTTTASVFELMTAARAMGAPEKLAAMLALMTRYVSVIKDEFERLVWAMKVRGFKATSSLHCLRSYANLAGVLLVRGLDRGERVHAAMLCRGYKGRFYFDLERGLKRRDVVFFIIFLLLAAAVVLLDVLSRTHH